MDEIKRNQVFGATNTINALLIKNFVVYDKTAVTFQMKLCSHHHLKTLKDSKAGECASEADSHHDIM